MLWRGRPCSRQFSREYVKETRQSFMDLSTSELDMFLMGQLIAFTNSSDGVVVESRHGDQEKRKSYCSFFHQAKPICRETFRFLHGIGEKKLKNVSKALRLGGIGPRVHGNTRRLPKHTLTLSSVEYIIRFLLNYCEQHGLLLPGRVPGYSSTDVKLLPSSKSKRGIWSIYREAAEQNTAVHSVAYSTFCRLWKAQLPYIIIMKPMTDLCWTCQQNSYLYMRATGSDLTGDLTEKTDALNAANEHLRIVTVERSFSARTVRR